ncbi:MAG: hypothetical protein LBB38_01705 [Puniceicoccales bacterium]|nr:hypothetical protein [Puniceicoccales bacterium]
MFLFPNFFRRSRFAFYLFCAAQFSVPHIARCDDWAVLLASGEAAMEKRHAMNLFHCTSDFGVSSVFVGPIISMEEKMAGNANPFDLRSTLYGIKVGLIKSFACDDRHSRQFYLAGGAIGGRTKALCGKYETLNGERIDYRRKELAVAAALRQSSLKDDGLSYVTEASVLIGSGSVKCVENKQLTGEATPYKISDIDLQLSISETHGFYRRGAIELGCLAGLCLDSIGQNGFTRWFSDGDKLSLKSLRHTILTTMLGLSVEDVRPGSLHLFGKIGWQYAAMRKHSDLSAVVDEKAMSSDVIYGGRHCAVISVGINHQLNENFAYTLAIEDSYGHGRASSSARLMLCRAF